MEPTNADIQSRLKEVDALIKKENAKRAKTNTANMTPFQQAKEEGNALYKDGKFPEAIVQYTRSLALATTDEEKVGKPSFFFVLFLFPHSDSLYV